MSFWSSSLVKFLKTGIFKQPNTLRKALLSRNQPILSKLGPDYHRANVAFLCSRRAEMSRTSRNRHPHECQYSGCKERQVKVRYENQPTRIRSRYCPDRRSTFPPPTRVCMLICPSDTCCHFPRCPEGKLSKHELYCAKRESSVEGSPRIFVTF